MDSIRFLTRSASLFLAVSCVVACSGKDPYSPGTKLGTFHVSAKLVQTTCGDTPNPWEFDVRLNHDGPTLFWIQGGTPIQGTVDTNARAELRSESAYEVRPADAKAKRAACALSRADVLNVVLSTGTGSESAPTTDPSKTSSFAGALVYTFTPTQGSECDDQVAESGGSFAALPCEIRYDLTGTFKSPPP